MNHIDLFSGIGGFALAAREVWVEDYHNVLFCDNNCFCQEDIKKNFRKDSVIYGDIREVTADSKSGRYKQRNKAICSRRVATHNGYQQVDLLTGGFPCQPFSHAGKRRGTEDNRYLWPEMLRVIQDFKPTWVIAENVRGILTIKGGLVFQQVCLDLETCGYEVQPFVIPAVAVNAPHRRDRVWIVANYSSDRQSKERQDIAVKEGLQQGPKSAGQLAGGFERPHSDVADTKKQRSEQPGRTRTRWAGLQNDSWSKNWLEVTTELCGVDDGLPAELDGFKLTKAGHRVERLKALGNAIVPQVAVEIFKAIKNSSK